MFLCTQVFISSAMSHFSKSFLTLSFCFLIAIITSCDDGEIIVKDFDFDNVNLQTCGSEGNYVFYKNNSVNYESLSLNLKTNTSLYSEPHLTEYTFNGVDIYAKYRRFDSNLPSNYYCNNIPPSTPSIMDEYTASSGKVQVHVEFREEDNTLYKDVHILLKDIIFIKENDQIIVETLRMGTIEGVEVVEL